MDTLKLAATVLARYLIVGVCTWLIKKGIITAGEAQAFQDPTVIGACAIAFLTIAAAVYSRLRSRFKTNVALQLPVGASHRVVEFITQKASVAEVISTQPKNV